MTIDYDYLCRVSADLAGIPIRVYRGEELISFHSPMNLIRDPALYWKEQLWSINDHVGYYLTENFYYYGILTSGDIRFIVGPTRQLPAQEQELREFAFRIGVDRDDAKEFCRSIKSITNIPIENLLLMLCSINYMIYGEKLELKDLSITSEGPRVTLPADIHEISESSDAVTPHNTYHHEQAILRIVRKGDTAALNKWMSSAPAIRSGIVASGHLRQLKNIFIVTATLCSRAAIQGGLDVDEALSLSDFYIQNCERLDTSEKITNLQYQMVLGFTERVERLMLKDHPGKLAASVANYVQQHLSENISTEALAQSLFMGRSYLSTKFHRETGIKLNDFILMQKAEEAKRLLRYTDRTTAAIGYYLAFSTPSHFTRVFKKYTGMTPAEYRAKHSI